MIRMTNVEKTYENGTHALNGISFEIQDGEFVFLVGPSGSGKSTIIKLLTGELVPSRGRVMINGFSMSNITRRQIPLMRRTVGVIFQDFRLIGNKTVYDNLSLAMRAVGASAREIKSRIPYVLGLVGLDGKAPAQSVLSEAQAIVDAERPIGADAQVIAAGETAVNIAAGVKLMDGGDLTAVQAAFSAALAEFFRENALRTDTVSYGKALRLLLDCTGVADVSGFTMNGGADSLTLTAGAVPVIGTLSLTEVTA